MKNLIYIAIFVSMVSWGLNFAKNLQSAYAKNLEKRMNYIEQVTSVE